MPGDAGVPAKSLPMTIGIFMGSNQEGETDENLPSAPPGCPPLTATKPPSMEPLSGGKPANATASTRGRDRNCCATCCQRSFDCGGRAPVITLITPSAAKPVG